MKLPKLSKQQLKTFTKKHDIQVRKRGNWRKWWHRFPIWGMITLYWALWLISFGKFEGDPYYINQGFDKTIYKSKHNRDVDMFAPKNYKAHSTLVHELTHAIDGIDSAGKFGKDYFIRPWPIINSYRSTLEFRGFANQLIKKVNQGYRQRALEGFIEYAVNSIAGPKYFWATTDKNKLREALERVLRLSKGGDLEDIRYHPNLCKPAGPLPEWMNKLDK